MDIGKLLLICGIQNKEMVRFLKQSNSPIRVLNNTMLGCFMKYTEHTGFYRIEEIHENFAGLKKSPEKHSEYEAEKGYMFLPKNWYELVGILKGKGPFCFVEFKNIKPKTIYKFFYNPEINLFAPHEYVLEKINSCNQVKTN